MLNGRKKVPLSSRFSQVFDVKLARYSTGSGNAGGFCQLDYMLTINSGQHACVQKSYWFVEVVATK